MRRPTGARGAADRRAAEIGAFEDDGGGFVGDFRVLAAHDARQCDRLFAVGDAEHIGRQLADVPVERGDSLALGRSADDDGLGGNVGSVKRVHRLAVFQHHIVRDVDDVVDRADACRAQTLAHPLGTGRNFDVFHHPRRVPQTKIVRRDLHVKKVCQIAFCTAIHDRLVMAAWGR